MDVSELYNLDPNFERAVLAMCCTNPRFWSRVGHALDPKMLGLPQAKVILETVRAIAAETGRGPKEVLIVIQRLSRKKDEGKLTAQDVIDISDLIDAAEDAGLPDEELAVNELVPVLQRRLQSAAVLNAHDEFAKRGDFTKTVEMLERAKQLGKFERISGSRLGSQSFAEIERVRNLNRLPTGILELDIKLNDGLARGQLGVWLGDAGAGKSIALVSQAAEGVRKQLFVGLATLELPEHLQLARLIANLTGVETLDIVELQHKRDEAKRRMGIMSPHIGVCSVAEFPPHATSVADIQAWVAQEEADLGRKMDLLVVDYGDKLFEPKIKDAANGYLEMRFVYEGLRRDIAVAKNMWVWTASQVGRQDGKTKRIDMHNVADSIHKVRVADVVTSLNIREEGSMMEFYVAKNRTGQSRFMVGPAPTDFARARIVCAASEWTVW